MRIRSHRTALSYALPGSLSREILRRQQARRRWQRPPDRRALVSWDFRTDEHGEPFAGIFSWKELYLPFFRYEALTQVRVDRHAVLRSLINLSRKTEVSFAIPEAAI